MKVFWRRCSAPTEGGRHNFIAWTRRKKGASTPTLPLPAVAGFHRWKICRLESGPLVSATAPVLTFPARSRTGRGGAGWGRNRWLARRRTMKRKKKRPASQSPQLAPLPRPHRRPPRRNSGAGSGPDADDADDAAGRGGAAGGNAHPTTTLSTHPTLHAQQRSCRGRRCRLRRWRRQASRRPRRG